MYVVEEGFKGRVEEDRLGKDRERIEKERAWQGMISTCRLGYDKNDMIE